MKRLFLIALLFASQSIHIEYVYQDHFWIGCMNAYIYKSKTAQELLNGNDIPFDEANAWCKKTYQEMKYR